MKIGLAGLILVSFLTFGLTEYALPEFYAHQIEAAFRQQVEKVESVDVSISTHPALLLLTGHIQNGSIHARGVKIQGLEIADLTASYKDLVFAKAKDGVKAVSGTNTYFQATFLEDDLNRYIKAKYPQFSNITLDLTPGSAALTTQVKLFNTTMPVEARGKFSVPNNHTIRFALDGLELGKLSLTSLANNLLPEVKFDVELGKLPLPLALKEVRVVQDRVEVLGGSSQ